MVTSSASLLVCTQELEEAIASYDYVFTGTRQEFIKNLGGEQYIFKVDVAYKGKYYQDKLVVVDAYHGGSTCGTSFVEDRTYLVFGQLGDNGEIKTGYCDGTIALQPDPDQQYYGSGKHPQLLQEVRYLVESKNITPTFFGQPLEIVRPNFIEKIGIWFFDFVSNFGYLFFSLLGLPLGVGLRWFVAGTTSFSSKKKAVSWSRALMVRILSLSIIIATLFGVFIGSMLIYNIILMLRLLYLSIAIGGAVWVFRYKK